MKKLLAALALSLSLLLPSLAQADAKGAETFATSIGNDALQVLSTNKGDAAQLAELQQLFARTVDTDWIAQFVVGRTWRTMNETQKSAYKTAYKDFLINHYTANFKEYTKGTSFSVTGSKPLKADTNLVTVTIKRKGEQDVTVNYRVREMAGTYKVTDIIVEGVSLLTTQRAEFSSVIQKNGIDYLITQLQKRSDTLAPQQGK